MNNSNNFYLFIINAKKIIEIYLKYQFYSNYSQSLVILVAISIFLQNFYILEF